MLKIDKHSHTCHQNSKWQYAEKEIYYDELFFWFIMKNDCEI